MLFEAVSLGLLADEKSGQRAAVSFFRAKMAHGSDGGHNGMRADGRTSDGIGLDAVLREEIEHRVGREKSTFGIERGEFAIEVVVALQARSELHLAPDDGLALQKLFQPLFQIATRTTCRTACGIHFSHLLPTATL